MFLRKCRSTLSVVGALITFNSFGGTLHAEGCSNCIEGNHLGVGINYTMKTLQYGLDPNYSMSSIIDKVQSPVMNNYGYGINASYTKIMDNDFFLEGVFEYKKQQNFMLIDRSKESEIIHRSFGVSINGGYTLDLGYGIRPFASVGVGMANFNTKLKFYYQGRDLKDKYLTNFHNSVSEIRPFFNYKLGLQAVLERAIIEVGYQYVKAQDLKKHLNAQGLNLVTETGKQSSCFGIAGFKNRSHNAFADIKFVL